jgi:hypothetical protein
MLKKLQGFMGKDQCTILFFILVFLYLFSGRDFLGYEKILKEDSSILFFILVFLILFADTDTKRLYGNV